MSVKAQKFNEQTIQKPVIKIDKSKYLNFPQKFKNQLGTEVDYRVKGKPTTRGVIDDMRWSMAYIMVMKNGKRGPEYRGIELRIKPSNGSRAFWTKAFNSGISVGK